MQIPELCLPEKPMLGEQSCSSCPPQGEMPRAAAASTAPVQGHGKGQPGAAPTQAKPTWRSSAVSHHPSWISLSALFVSIPVPSPTQCPFRTHWSEWEQENSSIKGEGRPQESHCSLSWHSTECTFPLVQKHPQPTSRLLPNSLSPLTSGEEIPWGENGNGEEETASSTSKGNTIQRALGTIRRYIYNLSPP